MRRKKGNTAKRKEVLGVDRKLAIMNGLKMLIFSICANSLCHSSRIQLKLTENRAAIHVLEVNSDEAMRAKVWGKHRGPEKVEDKYLKISPLSRICRLSGGTGYDAISAGKERSPHRANRNNSQTGQVTKLQFDQDLRCCVIYSCL